MRWSLNLLFLLPIALGMTGCGTSMSSKEFGTIIHEIPKVQGADQPYEMPQLSQPALEKGSSDKPSLEK